MDVMAGRSRSCAPGGDRARRLEGEKLSLWVEKCPKEVEIPKSEKGS